MFSACVRLKMLFSAYVRKAVAPLLDEESVLLHRRLLSSLVFPFHFSSPSFYLCLRPPFPSVFPTPPSSVNERPACLLPASGRATSLADAVTPSALFRRRFMSAANNEQLQD